MYATAFSRDSGTPAARDASENAASLLGADSVAAQDTCVSGVRADVAPNAAGATDSDTVATAAPVIATLRSEDLT
ncbi:hypothetical protein [Microtetraspora malaysiensis]|uniref:hypothetical protein n=1 Tax=Microtetraspora malaysiensis TaxID=161358 RepID=UPI003D8C6BBC